MALTDEGIRVLVTEWYRALDRHDELGEVLRYLVDDGLEMRFPETTAFGHAGFSDWYKGVTNRFFDEVHNRPSVDITALDEQAATVSVVLNWQPRIWTPPAAKSKCLAFDAYQFPTTETVA